MKTEPNEPANPFLTWNEGGYGDSIVLYNDHGAKQILPFKPGLTKREYFAAMAMQGQLSMMTGFNSPENIAYHAVQYADTLINELNKEDENK
jgi:hypothetical protein